MGIVICVLVSVKKKMIIEKNEKFLEMLSLVNNSNLSSDESLSLLGLDKVVLDRTDKQRVSLVTKVKKDRPENIKEGYKFCYICGEVKETSDFYKGQTRCKVCNTNYRRYNQKSRELHNRIRREKYNSRKQNSSEQD